MSRISNRALVPLFESTARRCFTRSVPGGNEAAPDVYKITLDPKVNPQPEYVQGTFFWHMDGLNSDIPPPKAMRSVVDTPTAEELARWGRLLEWTAQPDFQYSHEWQEGDLVVWDNCGTLHRVVPYSSDSGRTMHRTTIAGSEAVTS
jgi:hypothetical protein